MKRNKSNKGFTLAELLIVVGIIAVLVAISIPVFTSQLHKAKVATDWTNLRALYAEIQTEYITNSDSYDFLKDYSTNGTTKAATEIYCSDGSTIKLEAGTVTFDNKSYTDSNGNLYNYFIYYSCDNNDDEHALLISGQSGIQTYD